MQIKNLIKLNYTGPVDAHEFADGTLVVLDEQFGVVYGGKLHHERGVVDPARLRYTRSVYVVSPKVVNDETTPEHAVHADLLRAARARTASKSAKVKGNKPGHVYIARNGYPYLYLGKVALVNMGADALDTVAGHVYVFMYDLRHANLDTFPLDRNGQLTVKLTNDMVPRLDNKQLDLRYRADNHRCRTRVVFEVADRPRTFMVDAGFHGVAETVLVDQGDVQRTCSQFIINRYAARGSEDTLYMVMPH